MTCWETRHTDAVKARIYAVCLLNGLTSVEWFQYKCAFEMHGGATEGAYFLG